MTEAVIKAAHRRYAAQLTYKHVADKILRAHRAKIGKATYCDKVKTCVKHYFNSLVERAYHRNVKAAENARRALGEAPRAAKLGSALITKTDSSFKQTRVRYVNAVEGAKRHYRAFAAYAAHLAVGSHYFEI
jgi:hypothetical protein